MVRGSNPGRGEIFRTRPDRPWGLPSLLYNGYRVFPRGKAAGAWCWPHPLSKCWGQERVGLYLYSPSGPSWPVIGAPIPLPLPLHIITSQIINLQTTLVQSSKTEFTHRLQESIIAKYAYDFGWMCFQIIQNPVSYTHKDRSVWTPASELPTNTTHILWHRNNCNIGT